MTDTAIFPTQIGVISDIHGDINNLHRALGLFDKHGVDQIVCAGDLTDGAPYNDHVINAVRKREILAVVGNHDDIARQLLAHGGSIRPMDWHYTLTPENLEYLVMLPTRQRITVAERHIFITHASTWSIDDYMYINRPPAAFRRLVKESRGDNDVSPHVIILGHTHIPMLITVGNTRVVNPGSLWWNRNDDTHSCAILTVGANADDFKFHVYDVHTGREIYVEKREIGIE